MTYYAIRQEGHKEDWEAFSYSGEHPADRNAAQQDALGEALAEAQQRSRERYRPWVVDHVAGNERWQMARFPGAEREAEPAPERTEAGAGFQYRAAPTDSQIDRDLLYDGVDPSVFRHREAGA